MFLPEVLHVALEILVANNLMNITVYYKTGQQCETSVKNVFETEDNMLTIY